MTVADWLQALGLAQYETLFHENDIDVALLSRLTADDLKELGIASVGHRRRLMDAIAALGDDGAVVWEGAASAVLNRDPARLTPAERRHMTVLFCDIVGSTPLSVQLDPDHRVKPGGKGSARGDP